MSILCTPIFVCDSSLFVICFWVCVIKISGVKVYVLGLFGDIWVRVFTGEYKRTGIVLLDR